jgi:hypothetical protein
MEMTRKQNSGLFAVLVAAFLITACGQKFEPGSPEYIVQSLYKAAAKTGIPKDEATLAQYFDGRLTELLIKDFTCMNNGESCSLLDFDPVSQSKNPDINDLEIVKSESTPEVAVRFMQRDVEYQALCVMVLTRDGWRISDLIYSGADGILEPPASLLTALAMQETPKAPWHPPVPGMPENIFH